MYVDLSAVANDPVYRPVEEGGNPDDWPNVPTQALLSALQPLAKVLNDLNVKKSFR